MVQDKEKTKVIFRVFKEGDVIAIFPEELGTNDHYTCLSYMHLGQHGTCDPEIRRNTRLATQEEYASLKVELESLGYNLDIKKRYSYYSLTVRLNKIQEIRKQVKNDKS